MPLLSEILAYNHDFVARKVYEAFQTYRCHGGATELLVSSNVAFRRKSAGL